jgi:hypothetical protein
MLDLKLTLPEDPSMATSPPFSELPSNLKQLSISSTDESHWALASYIDRLLTRPLPQRQLKKVERPPRGTANPIYEL